MRIRATQLLKVEDFGDEQKKWIGKLISPINDFINQAIRILNDGIQFPDNFICADKLFSFTYQSDSLTFPLSYQWTKTQKPNSLVIVSALEDNNPIIAAAAWSFTVSGQVQLTSIVKLTSTPTISLLNAGSKYQIRARITP